MCSRLRRDAHYFLIILGLLLIIGVLGFPTLKQTAVQNYFSPAYDADKENYNWEISEYATGLDVPWDMAFSPDGKLFITERPGNVKLRLSDGTIKTIAHLPQVSAVGESGLTGIALHPHFTENNFVYLYYTYRDDGTILNRVSRYTFQNNQLINETYIVNNLKGGSIHNGGRLRFGPDEKLWVLTGDAARPNLAQDPTAREGKVLRMNEDGSAPEDNPTKGSLVYSLGHRNPQGLDWHPLTEELIVSSHGETAHDELNLVTPNGNYGWPVEKRCNEQAPYIPPLLCSGEETWAPSGIAFWGTDIWRFRYSLFFAGLRSGKLQRIAIIDSKVAEQETIIDGKYGRLRGLVKGPDGALYVSTSNKDGRGKPETTDDRILRVVPKLIP
ncbi:MAG TPA: PQQ-dependent sugar dehydrogenase [Patescibacteria group bacterium]